MQKLSLQSTNTGFAPISVIAPTVATNVFAAVITSSPIPTFKAFKDNFIASVPEFTPIAYLQPINFAKFFSNLLNSFPRVKSPVFTNFFNFNQRSSVFLNCLSKYDIKDAVNDLKIAFEKNLFTDPLNNIEYFNIKKMQNIKLK